MSNIRIQRFVVSNYRSIADASLDFTEGAVGLIGVNASGKTNVGRAFLFFCELVQRSLPQIGGPSQAGTALSDAVWQPLDQDPSALLFDPTANSEVSLEAGFLVPPYVIPGNQGQVAQGIDLRNEFLLEVKARSEAQNLPTGEFRLVPRYEVTINGKGLQRVDIQQLQGLWKQFEGARLQALRPAQEYLNALGKLSNESVPGHNAFQSLNDCVQNLDQNFARISFISNNPMGIEGDIPDLSVDNMSTGNLRAFQLAFAATNPEYSNALVLHIEEPETHFHPSLQRAAIRQLVTSARDPRRALVIETHSPQVLRELYALSVPVYRTEIIERDEAKGTRLSKLAPLPRGAQATEFLSDVGIDGGFALLGGVTVITDGPTDPPVYRQFLSLFGELSESLYCFVPIGCLEARQLDLKDVASLSAHTVVIADGHYQEKHGDKLEAACKAADVKYVQLLRWGVENFLTVDALRSAADEIESLGVAPDVQLDKMRPLKDTDGITNFSKTHHLLAVARHMTREELESQEDFAGLIAVLQELK